MELNIKIFIKYSLGIFLYPFFREYPQVFVYHEVTDNPNEHAIKSNTYVTPEIFEKQLQWILKRYYVLDPSKLLNNCIERKDKPFALITFDDGHESIFKNAAPILRKYNLKALLFLNMEPFEGGHFIAGIVSYFMDRDKSFKEKILKAKIKKKDPLLRVKKKDIDRLINLATKNKLKNEIYTYSCNFVTYSNAKENTDTFTYGNHLYNHYNASMLSLEDLNFQFDQNIKSLKKINGSTEFFAYPYGQKESCYNKKTDLFMRNKKVKKVFYSSGCLNKNLKSFSIDRISAGNKFELGYMKYITSAIHPIKDIKNFILKTCRVSFY